LGPLATYGEPTSQCATSKHLRAASSLAALRRNGIRCSRGLCPLLICDYFAAALRRFYSRRRSRRATIALMTRWLMPFSRATSCTSLSARGGSSVLLDTGKVEIAVISQRVEPHDIASFKVLGIDILAKRSLCSRAASTGARGWEMSQAP
jgi:hypothetical protein